MRAVFLNRPALDSTDIIGRVPQSIGRNEVHFCRVLVTGEDRALNLIWSSRNKGGLSRFLSFWHTDLTQKCAPTRQDDER